jgi:hypothetical protein
MRKFMLAAAVVAVAACGEKAADETMTETAPAAEAPVEAAPAAPVTTDSTPVTPDSTTATPAAAAPTN